MGVVLAGGTVIEGLESAMVESLFPVLHVHDAGARRIVADQNIVSFVVVYWSVSVHDLGHDISAYFGEGWAENDSHIGREPSESGHKLVKSSQMEPLDHRVMVQQAQDMRFCVFDIGDRSKSKILINIFLNNGISLAEGYMHLHGALTVSNVVQFLVGDLVDVGEDCGEVVIGHVLEGELPKLFTFVGIVFYVFSWMFITSAVAQPYIVTFIGKHESRSFVLVVKQPSVGTVQKTVLEENGFET